MNAPLRRVSEQGYADLRQARERWNEIALRPRHRHAKQRAAATGTALEDEAGEPRAIVFDFELIVFKGTSRWITSPAACT